MKAPATVRNTKSNGIEKLGHEEARYQKVFDGRKQPIRGLWLRNDKFYARLTVEENTTGKKEVRRVHLIGAQTVPQAQAALRQLLAKRDNNALPVLKQTPKLSDYVKHYFAYYRAVKDAKRPATLAKEEGALRLWVAHLGETRLDKITRAMINSFIAKRQADGISGRTVNLDVIALRNVLKRAIDDAWLKRLPTENMRPLKGATIKRQLVTADVIAQICETAQAKNKDGKDKYKNGKEFADYVWLLAYSGARRNEALRLRWSDVDWERRQLKVGSDGLAKNHEARVVDFNADLENHLKAMATRKAPDSDFLFPSPQRGDKDIPAKTFMETLKLARDESGLHLNFHDCRHFFISMAVMSGIDYMTIARWVGHKDGGVLIGKVYGHLSNEHAQRQAQRLIFAPVLVAV